jgi:hypothetical protein
LGNGVQKKDCGGVGILNLKKFASALRIRWLWHEWDDDPKPWVGLGNTCTTQDKELLRRATTKVTIGNEKKLLFWESTWVHGARPKDIAPLIFDLSKRKRCTVPKALEEYFWVTQINHESAIS